MHFFIPRLVGEVVGKARHLGCPKIVLDHVHVYNILYKLFVHTTMLTYRNIFLPLQQIIKHGVWLLMKPYLQ